MVFVWSLWSLTLFLAMVFVVERIRGKRYASRVRGALDQYFDEKREALAERIPMINHRFFRHLFHYIIHSVLSRFLKFLEWIERSVRAIVRLNRQKARVVIEPRPDSHLGQVVVHKEETALTEKEKKARKRAALEGKS